MGVRTPGHLPPKVKASDLRYILPRLGQEAGVDERAARRAYEKAGGIYDRAKRILEEERKAEEERIATLYEMQRTLHLFYKVYIRPALEAYMRWQGFNPLVHPDHAMFLHRELIVRGVTAYAEKDGELFVWHISTRGKGGSWRSGVGISDVFEEALVLAWWQAFETWAEEVVPIQEGVGS